MTSPLDDACAATGLTASDISLALSRIAPHAHRTPVLTSNLTDLWLSPSSATSFFFKAESLQRTGSFKFRGAINALANLSASGDERPVVAHSSGNHAQALAAAAAVFSRRAFLVIPHGAALAKLDAAAAYGATIIRCENTLRDREQAAERVVKEVNGVLVHPFLNPAVVAGQGTVAMELLEQVPGIDAIVVPIGGGGLISGVSIAAKAANRDICIVGAEPARANAAQRSLAVGERVQVGGVVHTAADGLKASVGELGWAVVSRLVDLVISVPEQDILDATKFIWQRMKLVIEPSAGVGVAAARTEQFRLLGFKRVGVILCGGNVDLDKLPWNLQLPDTR